jgi:hypothetical protein
MPDDLYDRDILRWAEQQAGLLRRVAGGERVNEAVDWPHIIEEVEDLGRAELHAVESLLRQAMLHLLKLNAGADQPAAHWRAETLGFLADAASRFTSSMRQRIELDRLYDRAKRQAEAGGMTPQSAVPDACPWPLDALLSDTADIDALLASLVKP